MRISCRKSRERFVRSSGRTQPRRITAAASRVVPRRSHRRSRAAARVALATRSALAMRDASDRLGPQRIRSTSGCDTPGSVRATNNSRNSGVTETIAGVSGSGGGSATSKPTVWMVLVPYARCSCQVRAGIQMTRSHEATQLPADVRTTSRRGVSRVAWTAVVVRGTRGWRLGRFMKLVSIGRKRWCEQVGRRRTVLPVANLTGSRPPVWLPSGVVRREN